MIIFSSNFLYSWASKFPMTTNLEESSKSLISSKLDGKMSLELCYQIFLILALFLAFNSLSAFFSASISSLDFLPLVAYMIASSVSLALSYSFCSSSDSENYMFLFFMT